MSAPVVDTPKSDVPGTPDIVLERVDNEGVRADVAGEQVLGKDAQQTLLSAVLPGQTEKYLIHINNIGQSATTFRVFMKGIISTNGADTPWAPKGWSGRAALEGDTKDIFEQLKNEQGWETPLVQPKNEIVIKLDLTAPPSMIPPISEGSFRVLAQKGELRDVVIGRVTSQFISKIQWTQDADETHANRWHDVTKKTNVLMPHYGTLLVRAEKAVSWAPWVNEHTLGPVWTFQGHSIEGDDLSLGAQKPTIKGAPLTATLGNSKSFMVRVLPDSYTHLTVNRGFAILPAKGAQTKSVLVSVKVEDDEYDPVAAVKVRLQAFKGNTAISGFWTPERTKESTKISKPTFLTDENGEIQLHLSLDAADIAVGDKVRLVAETIDEEGNTFGREDDFNLIIRDEQG
ncbi:hypothetical protein EON83_08135 [bacterium]|nr:MAG: hypothetical protein EON83_08135 [bacterium]